MTLFAWKTSPVAISNPLYIQVGTCIPGLLGNEAGCSLGSLVYEVLITIHWYVYASQALSPLGRYVL